MRAGELSQHSALYPDPEVSWQSILVHAAEPALLEPPTPEEGYVNSVEMDYRDSAGDQRFGRCQHCGRSMETSRPHVEAVVVLKPNEVRRFHNQKFVRFCDRECWGGWARRS